LRVGAQVEGRRAVEALGQAQHLFGAHEGGQALGQPVGQVGGFGQADLAQLAALDLGEEVGVAAVEALAELAQGGAFDPGQPGQHQVAGGRALAAQALEGALAAQHAIHGLGHEGPVAGAELAEIAEEVGQHRVGGVVEAQHRAEGLAGGLDLGGGNGHGTGAFIRGKILPR
jgi:hypothetical protein